MLCSCLANSQVVPAPEEKQIIGQEGPIYTLITLAYPSSLNSETGGKHRSTLLPLTYLLFSAQHTRFQIRGFPSLLDDPSTPSRRSCPRNIRTHKCSESDEAFHFSESHSAQNPMPFDCTDITEEIPEHAKMPPTWITGNGQTVYLVDCWYLVYENGNRQEPTERCDKCSKQGKLPTGTEIFIGGDEKGKWWVS